MYHRVAEPESDIWGLAVSPTRFEEHLQVLKGARIVVPLQELIERIYSKTLPRRSIAISFDDGYVDNVLAAKPLLEHYQLPATFFITAGNIGLAKEFWWDELEHLLLFSEHLPPHFLLKTEDYNLEADLTLEWQLSNFLKLQHSSWRAGEQPPPSARARLYVTLWQKLKQLPYSQQQLLLAHVREWAGVPLQARSAYQCLSPDQLSALSNNRLFTIGSHTLNHPSLSSQLPQLQNQELKESKLYLEYTLKRDINLLSYPYGDADTVTENTAEELSYQSAFTTTESTIRNGSPPFRLGRFQVYNWDAKRFSQHLKHWFNYC